MILMLFISFTNNQFIVCKPLIYDIGCIYLDSVGSNGMKDKKEDHQLVNNF